MQWALFKVIISITLVSNLDTLREMHFSYKRGYNAPRLSLSFDFYFVDICGYVMVWLV